MGKPRFLSQPPPPVNHEEAKRRSEQLTKRQYVRFAFYKVAPEWRRLPPEQQAEQKQELVDVIKQFDRRMLLRPYSTMGTRADSELLLWQIAETPIPFQELAAAIARTRMGAYLEMVYSYFSQTKRSLYEIRDNPGEDEERLIIQPTEAKYLFMYPFIKTRDWYLMSFAARQGVMDEHITVGRKYPSIKLNTTYSFGIDDYEFVLAFETDEPADFLDLVQELRETESSRFTLQDTPLFTCINMRLEETLDALGGPAIAKPIEEDDVTEEWVDVCPAEELQSGQSRKVYLGGEQVAVFNVNDKFYAISNRCSHARGPLAEGDISVEDCAVVCPWHYAKFSLETGQVVDGIASAPVMSYQVEVRDGVVWVGSKQPELA